MDVSLFFSATSGTPRERKELADCTCTLCGKVAVEAADPVLCSEEHVFCRACIKRHLSTSHACPVDNKFLRPEHLKSSRRVVRFVQRLQVRCTRHTVESDMPVKSGCRWVGPVHKLPRHVESECAFRTVKCARCSETFQYRALSAHQLDCHSADKCPMCDVKLAARDLDTHLSGCPAARVPCPNMCLVETDEKLTLPVALQRVHVLRSELDAHLQSCPMQRIECPYRKIGCAVVTSRKHYDDHMRSDILQHMDLLLARVTSIQPGGSNVPNGLPKPVSGEGRELRVVPTISKRRARRGRSVSELHQSTSANGANDLVLLDDDQEVRVGGNGQSEGAIAVDVDELSDASIPVQEVVSVEKSDLTKRISVLESALNAQAAELRELRNILRKENQGIHDDEEVSRK